MKTLGSFWMPLTFSERMIMKEVGIGIVDDHEIVRYAIRRLLEQKTEAYSFSIVGEADNGISAVELATRLYPDLMIMGISMPCMNGIEATRKIRAICPKCKVVIFTRHNRRRFLRELIKLGISGYVHKAETFTDLLDAIQAALKGEVYLSPRVAQKMAKDYASIVAGNGEVKASLLSPRQKEVLQLIVEGKGTKEVAAVLGVSAKAVESARHRLMQKLEMDNLADLTKYALREGLTTLEF
jgi:DNA-binding NarL/FixJ family response regulator